MEQGLSKTRSSSGNWLHFKEGVLMHNKEVYEEITGRIVELDITDEMYLGREFKKLTLFIKAGDETYKLGMDLGSGYGNAFCMMSPNVDWKDDVTISGNCEVDKDNGKKYSSLFISQTGKNVKWYWTKANPGKLPQPVKLANGTYDWSKRNDFVFKMLCEKVRTAILKANPGVKVDKTRPKPKDKVEAGQDVDSVTEAMDGLPF